MRFLRTCSVDVVSSEAAMCDSGSSLCRELSTSGEGDVGTLTDDGAVAGRTSLRESVLVVSSAAACNCGVECNEAEVCSEGKTSVSGS